MAAWGLHKLFGKSSTNAAVSNTSRGERVVDASCTANRPATQLQRRKSRKPRRSATPSGGHLLESVGESVEHIPVDPKTPTNETKVSKPESFIIGEAVEWLTDYVEPTPKEIAERFVDFLQRSGLGGREMPAPAVHESYALFCRVSTLTRRGWHGNAGVGAWFSRIVGQGKSRRCIIRQRPMVTRFYLIPAPSAATEAPGNNILPLRREA